MDTSNSSTVQDCDRGLCHYHGKCVTLNGAPSCDCLLGYRGTHCQDRVSESIWVPLTFGFLGVLIGVALLAFMCSFIWKRVKSHQRKVVGTAHRIPMVDMDK